MAALALGLVELDAADSAVDGGVVGWLDLMASERALGVLWVPRASSRSNTTPSYRSSYHTVG